jgi:carbon storage regulator
VLVLTRKQGEQIIIAGEIRITVVSVGQGRVKLGIEAPESVKVDRQEIHDKKQPDTPVVVPPLHNRIADKLPAADAPKPHVRRKPR